MAKEELIPRLIHCCWFGGKEMPALARKCMNSWKEFNPQYEIKIWNENNFDINSNQYTREAYEKKKWAFVTDYVRLKVLYDYGGIYMDTDVEVLKPLDRFLTLSAFSGFESNVTIPTGIIGAAKNNYWIEMLLGDYENRKFIKSDGSMDYTTNVESITATTQKMYPINLNNTLQSFNEVTIYPFDWFCAKDLTDGIIKKTENTYTIHHFAGSWLPPRKQFVSKLTDIIGAKCVMKLVEIKHWIEGCESNK